MPDQLTLKSNLIFVLLGIIVLLLQYFFSLTSERDRFVMCNIGQGDGMYMRIGTYDIVIDAGSDIRMSNCLGRYMRFFDRTIELAIITNSDMDHFGGFNQILDRYTTQKLLIPPIADADKPYQRLLNRFKKKGSKIVVGYAGNTVDLGEGNTMAILWPLKRTLDRAEPSRASLSNVLDGVKITGETINKYSFVIAFTSVYGSSILFTGDIDGQQLDNYLIDDLERLYGTKKNILIYKVPHHGSRTGISKRLFKKIRPAIALISAGVRNRYGHPHGETIKDLMIHNIPYAVTSKDKDILFDFVSKTISTHSRGGFVISTLQSRD